MGRRPPRPCWRRRRQVRGVWGAGAPQEGQAPQKFCYQAVLEAFLEGAIIQQLMGHAQLQGVGFDFPGPGGGAFGPGGGDFFPGRGRAGAGPGPGQNPTFSAPGAENPPPRGAKRPGGAAEGGAGGIFGSRS